MKRAKTFKQIQQQSKTTFKSFNFLTNLVRGSTPGMSNVRPAGRMRPVNRFNAACEMIFSYDLHAARERI